ncbi:cupin domain-containing protein [Hypericibacter sp.]|uniref:cupin domain-containing protein n=1 Tax=Hypericibacter sp. TaxID=2705401 RepID=UPI003D6D7598
MSETGEYSDNLVTFLELIWGQGFMAPGGPDLVRDTVAGLDLKGKRVLDIGSGLGGPDIVLAQMGAKVVGLDIEAPVIERARKLVAANGVSDRVSFKLTKPGPLPFADESFDLVYSSGAFTQIAAKEAMFTEVRRVLKPGGWFAVYDWMKGPGPISDDMRYFYKVEGLTYAMETPSFHKRVLKKLGFDKVTVEEDGGWYRTEAHREHQLLAGELHPRVTELLGRQQADHFVENWRAMTVVLDKGEHRPGRWRARKPLAAAQTSKPNKTRKVTMARKVSAKAVLPVKIGGKGPKIDKATIAAPISGKPKTTTQNFYTDATGSFVSGIWTATKGKWAVDYGEEEFIYLLAGKVKLTAANGQSKTFKKGEAFMIPAGFKGTWETLAPIRKFYAIQDRRKK